MPHPHIYRDDTGALVLHFGHGDLLICTAHLAGQTVDEVFIAPAPDGGPVGARTLHDPDNAPDSGQLGAVVHLVFDSVAGLDALRVQLDAVRAALLAADHG